MADAQIPDKPALEGLEQKWDAAWAAHGTYLFDRAAAAAKGKAGVFSVDTPPPTASGSLHIGHVFSYTHTDVKVRFERMRGKTVFYPMGWDDNGLPTERRVQNYYGVRCDTSLPYDPDFTPPFHGDAKSLKPADQVPISRRNFIDLCEELTIEDEKQFEAVFRQLGLSVDWTQTYRTISDDTIRTSQLAFLRNLERGEAYQAMAPTLWDIDFRSAIAQAELEDRDQQASYHRLAFHKTDGSGDIHIETTRPELLAACVALVANPGDERYQPYFGKTVRTPIFDVEVPVLAHPLAQQDKGSGIAMVCTFGDVTDIIWWRELDLPNRTILGQDGRILADAPDALVTDAAQAAYAEIAGLTVFSAKKKMVELLEASGELLEVSKPFTHPVKFYEKGDRALEIVSTRQWYLRNGARDEAFREKLIALGRGMAWHPDFMRVRYENWTNGLTGDWLISRQRFFGVPIPVWYALDENGERTEGGVLTADAAFDPQNPTQVKIGRRLAIKVLNAAKFVLSFPVPEGARITHALDASMLTTLDRVVREATAAFENYDHARALELTEAFFWTFCDDYLELVKERAYNQADTGQASAALALRLALSTLLRLLAPVLAFATEEAWSWFEEGSIHTATWPEPLGIDGDPAVLTAASEALIGIRRAKTEAKASQKTPVARLVLRAPDATAAALTLAEGDLKAVGRIESLEVIGGADALVVDTVQLAAQPGAEA